MYMFYTAHEHTVYVSGTALQTEEERTVSLRKGWNVLPYLRTDNMNLRDALADYYSYATEGDIVKSHDEFAYFSANNKWEGNLTYMQPGKGYLFYRQAASRASFTYPASSGEDPLINHAPAFRNPDAATNMTLIARVMDVKGLKDHTVYAYLDDELVGKATRVDSLFFLTIASDKQGTLRFETEDGEILAPVVGASPESERILSYEADTHHGTPEQPVLLVPAGEMRPYKIIEDNHVVIIRNNEKYDVTGKVIR